MKKIKRIGLLTRDCAGMNACIRAVVRTASTQGIEVLGIFRGYDGLMYDDVKVLTRRSVSGILGLGGTILKTSRAKHFLTLDGQKRALRTLKKYAIDCLVVAGGNGSLAGAHVLSAKYGFPVIGIPSTIDNDISGTDICIGADTAVNVALDCIDKIRDTATSLERIFVVEVMGRDCGYLALNVALAGGCENIIIPEKKFDLQSICEEITEGNVSGKRSWIVIVAEGAAKAAAIALTITEATGLETREIVLGHIQRGGNPTAWDRILAARFGHYAVTLAAAGAQGVFTALHKNSLRTWPLAKVLQPKRMSVTDFQHLIKTLT